MARRGAPERFEGNSSVLNMHAKKIPLLSSAIRISLLSGMILPNGLGNWLFTASAWLPGTLFRNPAIYAFSLTFF
jgi:hypothetical protein